MWTLIKTKKKKIKPVFTTMEVSVCICSAAAAALYPCLMSFCLL